MHSYIDAYNHHCHHTHNTKHNNILNGTPYPNPLSNKQESKPKKHKRKLNKKYAKETCITQKTSTIKAMCFGISSCVTWDHTT